MKTKQKIAQAFPYLNSELVSEIEATAVKKEIPKGTEILREGQYVSVVPIVLDGLIKVFKQYKERDLLLYYIKPGESCIMSFAAGLRNEPINVFARTEENTTAILLSVEKISGWMSQYPDLNTLIFQQYNLRYGELLDTIHQVLFNKLDKRIYDYLKEKTDLLNKNPLKISHREIAADLGTAREVVSRVIKKLEHEGKLDQQAKGIKILQL